MKEMVVEDVAEAIIEEEVEGEGIKSSIKPQLSAISATNLAIFSMSVPIGIKRQIMQN